MKLQDLEMYQHNHIKNEAKKNYYLIYCRKSSESEDRQMQSVEDQLTEAEKIRVGKNLEVVETFSESRSAKMPGRSEFNRMIETIYQRKDIKGIICWKLNRLARNPKDEGTLRWLLQSGEIEEIITPDKTYTQVDSDFVMAIDGAQSQRFITDLRKDTARGIKSKLDKGIAPILAPPGYRNSIEKRQGERDIVPHETQFPLVRKIFDYALTDNYSSQQLCLLAGDLGVKSNRKKLISRTQTYKMLRDPFYTGTRFIYSGKLYTNGVHKRMVTDEEFDLLQDILSGRSRPRGQKHKDLLTGLMVCGECGRGITTEVKTKHYKNGNSQVFVYYRCTKKWKGSKCTQRYVRAEELEKQVDEYLDSVKLSPRFVEWAIKWLRVMHQEQEGVREARYEAAKQAYEGVIPRISKLVDLMISGIVTQEEGAIKKQTLEQEKQRLFEELSKIDVHVTEWTNLAIETFNFVKTAQDKFANGTIEQKKTILRVIGSNLILKNKKLTIEIRTPFTYIQKVAMQLKQEKREEPIDLPTITSQNAFLSSINVNVGDRRGSNPQHLTPQANALPLSYDHHFFTKKTSRFLTTI